MINIGRVYFLLSISVLFAIIGMVVGVENIELFYKNSHLTIAYYISIGLEFIILIIFVLSPIEIKKILLFIFTFFTGLVLSPSLYILISHNLFDIILLSAILSFLLFIGLSIFAIKTNIDFTNIGTILFVILIIVILASIINIFLKISIINLIISIIVGILFSFYVIYDTQKIIKGGVDNEYDAVIDLYIDLLNIFVSLLNIMGIESDND
jgi:modulator of FtsH protease